MSGALSETGSSQDLSYLDLPSFRNKYRSHVETRGYKFYVEGVKCGRCIQKIESLQTKVPDIQTLRVNMSNQQLLLEMQNDKASVANVVREIENLGFKLKPISENRQLQQFEAEADKQELRRLGVAAICASNIMMFSFATYFGADGSLKVFFEWLCFFLYLPVLSYVAWPFYKGFWLSLKQRSLSVDGPMAVASLAGFLFSSINLFRGQGSIYFDSLAGFLFLILLSRYFQRRLQRTFLAQDRLSPSDCLSRARKMNGESWQWTVREDLRPGDRIQVLAGEVIPVDGNLHSTQVEIDASFLTGESHAILKHQGMPVLAGTTLLSSHAIIDMTATGSETQFGRLVDEVQQNASQKARVQDLSDRWSQILLVTVFSTAAIYLILNWSSGAEQALERSLALIVLACPCAMAFGTPLALSFSLKKAFEKGFLIRSADVFEKILKTENIFFDKTGTLTERKLVVQGTSAEVSDSLASIVLGLEATSGHPVAEALRFYLMKRDFSPAPIQNVSEILGLGVKGQFNRRFYSLQSSESLTGRKSVALFEDEQPLIHFYLRDELLETSKALVDNFVKKGLRIFILSGDSSGEVKKVGQALGLTELHYQGEMSGEQKARRVRESQNSMMIGDGANDALAFQQASVGIAVRGSMELALKSSDVYLMSDDLLKIDELFKISKRAMRLIHRNLAISLVYNVLGGAAALMGFIHPLAAAILMPVSSGFILLSSWLGSRR